MITARRQHDRRSRSLQTIGWPRWIPHISQNTQAPPAALFASVFVVATTTMRTMIPLRVFGILTNIVLIATAIPTHNYLVDPGAGRAAGAQFLSAAPDAAAGARREEIGQQRPVDGMAEAVHDRAQMRGRRDAVLQGREGRGACSTSSAAGSSWSNPASNCRSAPSSANSACCRRRTCEPRRWNASRPALILSVSYSKVEELYVQNPAFGFYFLRLSSARLFQNIGNAGAAAGAADGARLAPRRSPPRAPGRRTWQSVLVLAALSARRFHRRGRRAAAVAARGSARRRRARSSAKAFTCLIDYQGPSYAQLYVDRLRRFVGRQRRRCRRCSARSRG